MSRLATSYTITWASGTYTITYASVYASTAFGDDAYVAYVLPNNTVYINVGQADELVTLDWTKNTNLSASSASDLIVKIAALTSGSAGYTSLTTDSLSATTTNGNIVITGNGTGIVRINDNLGINATPGTTTNGIQTDDAIVARKFVMLSAANNAFQYFGLGLKTGAMSIIAPNSGNWFDFDVGTSSSASATVMRVNGNKSIDVDIISTISANTDLRLSGHGTGITRILDQLLIDNTTNQLILGATRTATLNAPTPATSSRVYTFPDLSADYSVVGTEGTQTVNGAKTFTSGILCDTLTSRSTDTDLTLSGNGTGVVLIGDGLKLLTSGGTQSTLSAYEEYTDASFGFTGPFTGTKTCQLKLVRIGGIVLYNLQSILQASSSATVATSSSTIPARFRPVIASRDHIFAIDNSVAVQGAIDIDTAGVITIGVGPTRAVYTAANNAGWETGNHSYTIWV